MGVSTGKAQEQYTNIAGSLFTSNEMVNNWQHSVLYCSDLGRGHGLSYF